MLKPRNTHLWIWLWTCLAGLLGTAVLVRAEWGAQREAFETDARIAHRLMSQRVVQHDAILATLALVATAGQADRPEQRLPAVYPQILRVLRRDEGQTWDREALTRAEAESHRRRRAVLADLDPVAGRYELVLATAGVAYAMQIDLNKTVPWDEWPMEPARSGVRVTVLGPGGSSWVIQPGADSTEGGAWGGFHFEKTLASESQAFLLVAQRPWRLADMPWWRMAAWLGLVALSAAAWRAWRGQMEARQRAEELLRLGQVARLNTLGELAAGMAHELNQPLTAVLANTRAAARLLDDDGSDPALMRQALDAAAQQARRAADVVGRLRRVVERPDTSGAVQAVAIDQTVRSALHLLAPECERRHVVARWDTEHPVMVLADPVALEQIVHNLLTNALHALESMPVDRRQIRLQAQIENGWGVLRVQDSGPGLSVQAQQRLFQPFFSTRPGGLGLGLSLCETLAVGLGGHLSGRNHPDGGAEFVLTLPLADAGPPTHV